MQMVIHDKSMFSHFKHKGSKHYCRDQDPEMYECMMKNLLCSTFSKFLLVNCSLFNHQTHCYRNT